MINFSTEELRTISTLIKTQEGLDFLEILKNKSDDLYNQIVDSKREIRDELIGQALMLKFLIKVFNNCDEKLKEQSNTTVSGRIF